MKSFFLKLCILLSLGLGFVFQADAGIFDQAPGGGSIFGDNGTVSPYCDNNDCGLQQGIDTIRWSVDGLVVDRSLSEYVQDVVVYLLGFLSIIAVIYIIYAGFTLLTSGWDEEKLTSTKKTVLYVVIGLAIIWLAGPITNFVFGVLNAA